MLLKHVGVLVGLTIGRSPPVVNKRLALAFRIEKKRVLDDAIAALGRSGGGGGKDKKAAASSSAAFAA